MLGKFHATVILPPGPRSRAPNRPPATFSVQIVYFQAVQSPILEVQGLSKQYATDAKGQKGLLQGLLDGLRGLARKAEPSDNSFWALSDVSFTLDRGDVLGIVGRNGAGKSTLLRILSEVTPPTSGRVVFRGNVTSILEVGTGFHPDLSGRQNVYLSAALLGMRHAEVEVAFAEIVAFSGIERFIDMPVKHYSSGMYLRLAFAIAFHSRADILLLDEVLSVGDVEFRHKSAQRIKQIAQSGTTVLIVSHELPSIRNLCHKCLLLEAGRVRAFGRTQDILDQYLHQYYDDAVFVYRSPDNPDQSLSERLLEQEVVAFESIEARAKGKSAKDPIHMGDAVELCICYRKKTDTHALEIMLNLNNLENVLLSDSRVYRPDFQLQPLPAGRYEMRVEIPAHMLYLGTYYVDLIFGDIQSLFLDLPCIHRFTVLLDPWEEGKPWNMGQQFYALRPALQWERTRVGD